MEHTERLIDAWYFLRDAYDLMRKSPDKATARESRRVYRMMRKLHRTIDRQMRGR